MNQKVKESEKAIEKKVVKKTNQKRNLKGKFFVAVATLIISANTFSHKVYAADGVTNQNTESKITNTFTSNMFTFAWWAIIAILGIFGGMGIVKLVQAQSEEDPRGRNNGIATIVVCGICIAAAIAIKVATGGSDPTATSDT